MDKDTFQQEVYNVVAAIPPGRVVTYGQIAYLVGRPQCSRVVGHAMHDVPDGMCLPCHRVVNSQGRLAPCWAEQRALLEAEGVTFRKNGCVDMKKCQWECKFKLYKKKKDVCHTKKEQIQIRLLQ